MPAHAHRRAMMAPSGVSEGRGGQRCTLGWVVDSGATAHDQRSDEIQMGASAAMMRTSRQIGGGISRRAAVCLAAVCAWCAWAAGAAVAAVPGGPFGNEPMETFPQVASDAAGDAVAVWWEDRGDGTAVVQAASRPAGGAWQTPVTLSAPSRFIDDEPRVATNATGDVVAVWNHSNGSEYVMQAAARPAGGAWQAAVDISAPGHSADEPRLAVNQAGLAVVVWRDSDGSSFNNTIQAAARPAGRAWQAPVALSAPSLDAERPDVAVNTTGEAVAVWNTFTAQGGVDSVRVQAAARPASGTWRTPVNVSPANPRVLRVREGGTRSGRQRGLRVGNR